MLAEACGNRTHLARIRRHAGFEDQEGHQAHSASIRPSHANHPGGRPCLVHEFGYALSLSPAAGLVPFACLMYSAINC